jgi:hypothetical protein
MEEREQEKAKQRMAQAGPKSGRGKKKTGSGKLPDPVGNTRDILAARVGWSGKTYEKTRQVVQAARDNPTFYGPLAEKMDRTGSVQAA